MEWSELDPAALYARMARRDPSLDGVVYVAVTTTGIYCRPVCGARLPLERNIVFHPSAASAEAAGYRPCLRCRPESVPFSPAWKGTRSTVDRALSLIEAGVLDTGTVDDLAARLGVGARHVTRLFARHLGASPSQVARTARVHRAKRMLEETALPVSEVARRAGFASARRLHAAFSSLYGRPPSSCRRLTPHARGDADAGD